MKRARWSFEGGIAGLVMLAAAGCGTTGVAAGAHGSDTLAALPDVPDALIQMRRAPCPFDKCPVYSVSIFTDGTVVYNGRLNVGVVGTPTRSADFEESSFVFQATEARARRPVWFSCCLLGSQQDWAASRRYELARRWIRRRN